MDWKPKWGLEITPAQRPQIAPLPDLSGRIEVEFESQRVNDQRVTHEHLPDGPRQIDTAGLTFVVSNELEPRRRRWVDFSDV